MNHLIFKTLFVTLIFQWFATVSLAQIAGSRAVGYEAGAQRTRLLSTTTSLNDAIVIQGSAQRMIKPTELRMIWAITARDAVPSQANKRLNDQVTRVRQAWVNGGLKDEDIVEDFISAIPQYRWSKAENENVLTEEFDSFLVQTNLHVRVANDKQAHQVIAVALEHDITNLIGVDYYAEIDQLAEEVRGEALNAARTKSDQLFVIFREGNQPEPANIAEQTVVIGPDKQYSSFENVSAQRVEANWATQGREFVRIHAARPRNTYYRGAAEFVDLNQFGLPMKPQILIKSTVEIAYLTPEQREVRLAK